MVQTHILCGDQTHCFRYGPIVIRCYILATVNNDKEDKQQQHGWDVLNGWQESRLQDGSGGGDVLNQTNL
jgi:hypothetical protein